MNRNTSPVHKTKMNRINFLLLAVLFFVMVGGVYYACTSEKFQLTTMQIKGNDRLGQQEVAKISGVKYGENVFLLSQRAIGERLSANPYVESVKIKKSPPGSVLVELKEKKIIGYIQSAGQQYLLDRDGKIIDVVSQDKIRKTDAKIEVLNKKISLEDEKTKFLTGSQLDFIKNIMMTDYFDRIRVFDFTEPENLEIQIDEGAKILFNQKLDMKYQLEFLAKILQNGQQDKRIRRIVFREEDDPIVEMEE